MFFSILICSPSKFSNLKKTTLVLALRLYARLLATITPALKSAFKVKKNKNS